ncbi:hypothetical protein [Psychrobacter sp.]|uniref:hypothetical protein n=1 Tax=Psychrobacter sp. TaxID=56811 RepID=UPI0025F80325|nr:hypothetical protein [Psychrobacter sp.]
MKWYEVKYKRKGSESIITAPVQAPNASDAKEQIKARERGDCVIISCTVRK